jgi:nucleotide-binding universal stress UspA family protein
MTTANTGRLSGVVVAYDGSDAGDQTLEWAAVEALARGTSVTVVHVWEFNLGATVGMPPLDLQAVGEQILQGAVDHLRKEAPGVQVHSVLERGSAAARLIEVSRQAGLLVVGSRGRGGFSGLVLGSVGAQLAAHAECPVVVVRGADQPAPEASGRVVVGVDGSPASRAAVEMAFIEADAHRVPLAAIVAWDAEAEGELPPLVDEDGMREAVEVRLNRLLIPFRERHPTVEARTAIVPGSPREVLLDASAGARLLVVGSRGLGGIRGLMLGSVSHAMVHHALCPVAVVRTPSTSSA